MPPDSDQRHITSILHQLGEGDATALDRLMRAVHDDLNRMAAGHLRDRYGARVDQITLEPAALVNESFLRLIHQRQRFDNRGQFFAIATRIMLRVLGDYHRERVALKRGGGLPRTLLSLGGRQVAAVESPETIDIEALVIALDRLQEHDAQKADIVRMRVVWGMTVPMIAEALGVSASTVDRDWRFAKSWIATEIVAG